ncbi:hypothetical protein BT69DRAFT_690929 [Atractiella rhizophila]|nr:hypothetical protein BT69DRAFT_690929 [Atractiella rhizophila]
MSDQISEFGSVTSLKSRFEALASSKPSSQSTSPQPPSSPSQSQPPSLRARPPPPPPPLKPKPFATLPSRAGAFPSIEKETEKENGLLSPDSYGGEEGQRRYRSSSNPESGANRDEPPNPYRGIANVSRSSISMGEGGGGMRTSPSVPDFNIGNERAGRSVSLSSSALSASSPSSTPRSASPNQNATSSSTATSTSASGRRPAPPPPPSKSSLSRSTGSSLSTSPVRVRSPDPSSSPSSSREDARGLKGLISRFEELEQDLSDNSNRTGSGDMDGNEDPFAEIHRLESSSSFSIGAKLAPALPPRGGSLSSSTDTLIPLGLSNSQPQQEKPAIPARPPLTRPAISTLEPSPTPPPPLPQRASSSPIARSSPLLPLVPPTAPTNGALSVARLPSAPPLPARSATPATVSTTPTTITPPLPLPVAQADPKLPGATEWQAPPPPSRSIGLKEKLVPVRPVIKSPVGEEGGEGESSEDEGEEEDATAAALSRLPDATFANRKPPRLGKDLVVKAKAQHFTSYAIKGSIVCTGSSQVKVT